MHSSDGNSAAAASGTGTLDERERLAAIRLLRAAELLIWAPEPTDHARRGRICTYCQAEENRYGEPIIHRSVCAFDGLRREVARAEHDLADSDTVLVYLHDHDWER